MRNFTILILWAITSLFGIQVDTAFGQGQGGNNQGNNGGVGVTIQLPVMGVAVDASGVFTASVIPDPGGVLARKRIQAMNATLSVDVRKASKLRHISLKRLEEQITRRIDRGEEPTEEMQHLAGLTKAQYVFLCPEERDIILAGPAEGWIDDLAGNPIGAESGAATLLLEDLIAALRAFPPDTKELNRWVACSIDPTQDGLNALVQFQRTIPRTIPEAAQREVARQVAEGMRTSLGNADIKIYGVSHKTHLARVMVEADYRMKLIAVGLEAPVPELVTFIGALRGASRDVQRWWFLPNYRCVRKSADGLGLELVGDGVVLATESVEFQKALPVATGQKPSAASNRYAESFTNHYGEVARHKPVFRQLRNIIDLLVASAWLAKDDGYSRASWSPTTLLDPQLFSIETHEDPKQAPCAANAVWKQNIMIAVCGGGVSITPIEALKQENLLPDDDNLIPAVSAAISPPADESNWWWD
jgi:hypothetical protein